MNKFTKKQEAAIRSFKRAYRRLDKVGLLLMADGEGGTVTRAKDWEKFFEEIKNIPAFTSIDFLVYVYDNELPFCEVVVG